MRGLVRRLLHLLENQIVNEVGVHVQNLKLCLSERRTVLVLGVGDERITEIRVVSGVDSFQFDVCCFHAVLYPSVLEKSNRKADYHRGDHAPRWQGRHPMGVMPPPGLVLIVAGPAKGHAGSRDLAACEADTVPTLGTVDLKRFVLLNLEVLVAEVAVDFVLLVHVCIIPYPLEKANGKPNLFDLLCGPVRALRFSRVAKLP